jgi:4-carboxymuconolactone decarboxylase
MQIMPVSRPEGGHTLVGGRASTVAPMDHFTGRARVAPLFPADADINASGAYVTFEPGARSAWHTHPAGQRLVVTSGVGLTQEWGKPVLEIRPGDVVWCPPGVKHWHGAAPTITMTHLAVTGSVDGKSVTWMEKVTDVQYSATGAAAPQGQTMTVEQTLSAKQQAIPLIASFMAVSDMPKLNAALNQGLDAGLTISETKEVLVQLYAYVGFPRSLNALGELLKVVEARKQRGVRDAPGREPSRAIPVGDELIAIGTANQTRLLARRFRDRSSTLRQSSISICRPICSATSSSVTISIGRAASWPRSARWPPRRAWSHNCARTAQ